MKSFVVFFLRFASKPYIIICLRRTVSTLNLISHLKLGSKKQNAGKVCEPNQFSDDVMFSTKKALSVTTILRLLVFHTSSRVLRLGKHKQVPEGNTVSTQRTPSASKQNVSWASFSNNVSNRVKLKVLKVLSQSSRLTEQ